MHIISLSWVFLFFILEFDFNFLGRILLTYFNNCRFIDKNLKSESLYELPKCSPIAILLPSHDSMDYKILETFLAQKYDIFANFDIIKKISNAFPLMIRIISQILEFEKLQFLPDDVTQILHALKKLKNNMI